MKRSLIWFSVVGFIAALLVVPWHVSSSTVQVHFSSIEQSWSDLTDFKMPVMLEVVGVAANTVADTILNLVQSPLPLEVLAFIALALASLIAFSRWSHPPNATREAPYLSLS
jgi:uncharacterized membrane protein YoaK (UPF0700 family)